MTVKNQKGKKKGVNF